MSAVIAPVPASLSVIVPLAPAESEWLPLLRRLAAVRACRLAPARGHVVRTAGLHRTGYRGAGVVHVGVPSRRATLHRLERSRCQLARAPAGAAVRRPGPAAAARKLRSAARLRRTGDPWRGSSAGMGRTAGRVAVAACSRGT